MILVEEMKDSQYWRYDVVARFVPVRLSGRRFFCITLSSTIEDYQSSSLDLPILQRSFNSWRNLSTQ
jgi:hypothetical protein